MASPSESLKKELLQAQNERVGRNSTKRQPRLIYLGVVRAIVRISAMFSSGVLLAGVIGDTVGGVVSDRLLCKTGSLIVARRSVIARMCWARP